MSCDEDGQSAWATRMPTELLQKIFKYLAYDDKNNLCLPTICKLGGVCVSWYHASASSCFWQKIDFSTLDKKNHIKDETMLLLIKNRLSQCKELNLGNWKTKKVDKILFNLYKKCPNLIEIGLNNWDQLKIHNLAFVAENFGALQRLDLSSVNQKSDPGLSTDSICDAVRTFGSRLTHLNLSNNRIDGFMKIVEELCMHCPNLELLDLSHCETLVPYKRVGLYKRHYAIFDIERVQKSCPKMKILRLALSINFNSVNTLEKAVELVEEPGFQYLEQLSVALLPSERSNLRKEMLLRILRSSSNLKLLDIRGCDNLTCESLLKLPTRKMEQLFLSRSSLLNLRQSFYLKEIIAKWKNTLTEVDFSRSKFREPLNDALRLLAEQKDDSSLRKLDLSRTVVSPIILKDVLINCQLLESINLKSCALPECFRRLFEGPTEIAELRKFLGIGAEKRKLADR